MNQRKGAAPTDPRRLAAELRPRLAQLTVLLRRQASAVAGLTPTQASVLYALRDGRPRRMSELADEERVTQPTMTAVVQRMQRQGWVTRRPDDDDRRVVRVTITAAGAELLDEVGTARAGLLADRLARLTTEERQAVAAVLPALDRLVED